MTLGETLSDIWDAITGFFGGDGKDDKSPDENGTGESSGAETDVSSGKENPSKKGSSDVPNKGTGDEYDENFLKQHGLLGDEYTMFRLVENTNLWQEVPRPSMDLDSIKEADAQKFVNQVLKNPELYDIKGYQREAVFNNWFGGRSELRTHSLFVVTTKDGKDTHTLSYNSNERWMLDTKTDLKGMERQDKYLGYDTEAIQPAREIDVQRAMERIDDKIARKDDTYFYKDHVEDAGPTVYNCNTAFNAVRINR